MKDKKVYAIDLDGTLCQGEFRGEGEPKPIQSRIDYINNIYNKGNIILIYTAREPSFFVSTYAWLIKYGVKHHGINMSRKPGADIYVDDKAVYTNDFFKDHINNLDFYNKVNETNKYYIKATRPI